MSDLNPMEIRALHEALDDEYRAWATYGQVIADFGDVRPFNNIRRAEERHIAALHELFACYGLTVPENGWPGRVPRYKSLHEACEAAVSAEIANGELYERLLSVTLRPDILGVLHNLQEASQARHLEAFRRCAKREEGLGNPGGGDRRRRVGHGPRS